MGGGKSAANGGRRAAGNVPVEPMEEGMETSDRMPTGADVSGVSGMANPGAAAVSGGAGPSALHAGTPSASEPPPDNSEHAADVGMDAADVSTAHADDSTALAEISEEDPGPGIPPPPDEDLPPLESLTKAPPSPLLGCHITSVLYAYCYVMRMFNGEWTADPSEASETLVAVSPVLSDAATPTSVHGTDTSVRSSKVLSVFSENSLKAPLCQQDRASGCQVGLKPLYILTFLETV